MGKILKYLALLILILVVAAGAYVYLHGQGLIRDGVQSYGPRVTGSPVALGGVQVMPWSGNGRISDLRVGNPAGFSNADALSLGVVEIDLEPASLFEDPLIINTLRVSDPRLLFELGKGGSNLKALQKNIQTFSDQLTGNSETAPARKVVIRELLIDNPQVVVASALGGVGEKSLNLADIALKDIGVSEGGVPASEAARLAMDAIMPQVTKALASAEGKKLLGKVRDELVGDNLPDTIDDNGLGKELGKGLNKLLQRND